jgi:hypothetical protein
MSNTLTYIQRQAFSGMQKVCREMAGGIKSASYDFGKDGKAKGVAVGEYVDVQIAPAASMTTFTPSNVLPSPTDQTAARTRVYIQYSNKTVPRYLTGEEIQSLTNAETDKDWAQGNIEQMIRACINQIESYLCLRIKYGASRAVGTAGTTPFGSDLSDLIAANKVLMDNGVSLTDRTLLVNSSAYMNMGNLGIVQQANLAGSDEERRSGVITKQWGCNVRVSAGIATHTAGTPSGTLFSATEPVGETSLAFDTDTNGPWNPGDILTCGSGGGSGTLDTNKYVIPDYDASATAYTTSPLTINQPGLILQHVDNDTMAVGADYTPCFVFERNAVALVVRPPFLPENAIIKTLPITDSETGLTLLLVEISQYGQVVWEMHWAGGMKAVWPQGICTILG